MREQALPSEPRARHLALCVHALVEHDVLDVEVAQRLLVARQPHPAREAVVDEEEVARPSGARASSSRPAAAAEPGAGSSRRRSRSGRRARTWAAREPARPAPSAARRRLCCRDRQPTTRGGRRGGRRRSSASSTPAAAAARRPEREDQAGDGDRGQGRDRQVGDRHEPAGDARVAKRREDVPEPFVEREVRPEGEHGRDDRGGAEERGQRAVAAPPEEDAAGYRQRGDEPAEVDELLEAAEAPAADEVEPVGRELADLLERPAARLRGVADDRELDRDSDRDGGGEARNRPERRDAREAQRDVDRDERDDAEREVGLPRERYRHDGEGREGAPCMSAAAVAGRSRALEGEEGQRQEHGDPAEEVRRRSGRGGTGRSRTRALRPPRRRAGGRARGASRRSGDRRRRSSRGGAGSRRRRGRRRRRAARTGGRRASP